MPTWSEIQEYARSKYKLQNDEDTWFGLVFAFENERSQKIIVRRFEAFDQEWIEFRTPICKEEEMAPKVALRKNSEMAIGTICLDKEMYFLIWNLPLKNLDIDEFELPLHFLTHQADDLEQNYSSLKDEY